MASLPNAAGTYTLLDLAKLRKGREFPVINEVIHRVPELSVFPMAPQTEQFFEVTVRTSSSPVYFRNTNEGIPSSRATFENKSFGLQLIDGRIIVDKDGLVMRSADQGARLMAQETIAKSEAATQKLVDQLWYGQHVDPKGFPGFCQQVHPDLELDVPTLTGVADAGANSTVWFVELGAEGPVILDGLGDGFNLTEFKEQLITDSNGDSLVGLFATLMGYFGCAVYNKYRIARLTRVGAKGSGNELTDALLNEMEELLDTVGMMPTHCFMSPRSNHQLRDDRTANGILQNTTGKTAPLPRTVFDSDVPIVKTINIKNNEETIFA